MLTTFPIQLVTGVPVTLVANYTDGDAGVITAAMRFDDGRTVSFAPAGDMLVCEAPPVGFHFLEVRLNGAPIVYQPVEALVSPVADAAVAAAADGVQQIALTISNGIVLNIAAGATGPQGKTGAPGPQGPAGTDGKSALDQWREYSGNPSATVADMFAALGSQTNASLDLASVETSSPISGWSVAAELVRQFYANPKHTIHALTEQPAFDPAVDYGDRIPSGYPQQGDMGLFYLPIDSRYTFDHLEWSSLLKLSLPKAPYEGAAWPAGEIRMLIVGDGDFEKIYAPYAVSAPGVDEVIDGVLHVSWVFRLPTPPDASSGGTGNHRNWTYTRNLICLPFRDGELPAEALEADYESFRIAGSYNSAAIKNRAAFTKTLIPARFLWGRWADPGKGSTPYSYFLQPWTPFALNASGAYSEAVPVHRLEMINWRGCTPQFKEYFQDSKFLTSSSASSTYLKQAAASSTYLQKASTASANNVAVAWDGEFQPHMSTYGWTLLRMHSSLIQKDISNARFWFKAPSLSWTLPDSTQTVWLHVWQYENGSRWVKRGAAEMTIPTSADSPMISSALGTLKAGQDTLVIPWNSSDYTGTDPSGASPAIVGNVPIPGIICKLSDYYGPFISCALDGWYENLGASGPAGAILSGALSAPVAYLTADECEQLRVLIRSHMLH